MKTTSAWSWAWGAWAVSTGGTFAWLEAMALRRNCHPTLSTTMRRCLGIHPRRRWAPAGLVGLVAFWTWLVVHLARVPREVT